MESDGCTFHLLSHPRADSIECLPCDGEEVPKRKVVAMPTDVLIVNIAVLGAVLEADLGRRKISRMRILRPLFLAVAIVPLFIAHPATAGNGEILEIALAGLGALLGVVAGAGLMKIGFDKKSQQCVSTAGIGYGVFWTAIIGARLLFTYGANHWYHAQLGHWMVTNAVTVDALTDALIFMALAMTVTRTLCLAVGRNQVRRQSVPALVV